MQLLRVISVLLFPFIFTDSERQTNYAYEFTQHSWDTSFTMPSNDDIIDVFVFTPKDFLQKGTKYDSWYVMQGEMTSDPVSVLYSLLNSNPKKQGAVILLREMRGQKDSVYYQGSSYLKDISATVSGIIIPAVERHFRALGDAKNRNFISMGGMANPVLYTAFAYPDSFAAVGVFLAGETISQPISDKINTACNGFGGKLFICETPGISRFEPEPWIDNMGEACEVLIYRFVDHAKMDPYDVTEKEMDECRTWFREGKLNESKDPD